MSLTTQQRKERDGKLTASRVACLMQGDEAKILNLWREMVGDPAYVEDDLSDIWAVQLGSLTESLNLEWYIRRTGRPLTRQGEVCLHPAVEWAACTLDAFDAQLDAVVEAKHVGGFEPREKVIERYQPQLHWQMYVTGTCVAAISIIEGAREPVITMVSIDVEYMDELERRAFAFMRCVDSLTPPVASPQMERAPQEQWRTVDLTGNNEWASYAGDWLENRDAQKTFAAAEKAIKGMIEPDVGVAHGHGINVKRSSNGALRIGAAK